MAENTTRGAMFIRPFIGFFMEQLSLCGEAVLSPDLLIVNERTLPRAVEIVLEG